MKHLTPLHRVFFFVLASVILISCAKKEVVNTESEAAAPSASAEAPVSEPTAPVAASLRPVYFDTDSADIGSGQTSDLEANVEWLKANKSAKVEIQGHCDERGDTSYNTGLGKRRADAVKRFLASKGIKASRLKVQSKGKSHPADPGHDESAWAKNRRAELQP